MAADSTLILDEAHHSNSIQTHKDETPSAVEQSIEDGEDDDEDFNLIY